MIFAFKSMIIKFEMFFFFFSGYKYLKMYILVKLQFAKAALPWYLVWKIANSLHSVKYLDEVATLTEIKVTRC